MNRLSVSTPRQSAKFKKSDASVPQKTLVALQTDGKCSICGKFLYLFSSVAHVDHVISWEEGGDNSFENLRLACDVCNVAKGASSGTIQGKTKRELRKEEVVEFFLKTLIYDYCTATDDFARYGDEDFHTRNVFNSTLMEWYREAKKMFKPTREHKRIREASLTKAEFELTFA